MRKIFNVLIILSAFSLYAAKPMDWSLYKKGVLSYQSSLEGWCKPEKATRMMNLIYEVKPKICVEIGVFGGASIYPTASALKYLNRGIVYAIDPWVNIDCLEGYDPNDANYQWWKQVDLNQIHRGFLSMLNRFELEPYCRVLRMTSFQALSTFEDASIDILHIDGNHTENSALHDAEWYLPKMKKGGYIWFDDVNWPTTRPAIDFLLSHAVKDEARSTSEYFLFRVQ